MAAPGSVPPLSSPAIPSSPHGPPTPSAFKMKSKLMDRHAQEGAHAHTASAPPYSASCPLPPLRPLVTVPPPLRLDTTPPPKKRLCTSTAWEPYSPTLSTHYPASPPQSPAPDPLSPEDPRGTTKVQPCLQSAFNHVFHRPHETILRWGRTPISPTAHALTHVNAHLSTNELDLRIPKAEGQVETNWRSPQPHSPPRSAPPHTAHRTHHYHNHNHHNHHHHHNHNHHRHHRHLSHPRPRPRLSQYSRLSGSPGHIMLSEPPMSRSHQDAMPFSSPTALNKPLVMDTSQQSLGDYKTKPIAQWTHWDVSRFFLEGPWGLQSTNRDEDLDFTFAAIDKVDGRELLSLSKSTFLNFSPKYGEKLYEHVQQRIVQERGEPPHHHHPTIHSPPSSNLSSPSSTSTSPLFTTPFTFTTSRLEHPHHLHHGSLPLHHNSQPSLICDAATRYEVRFEPPPPQPQPRFQGPAGGAGAYSQTPTALRKHLTLPPPLMALENEGRERLEERRDGTADGGSGEQSHPSEEEVKVEPPKKRGPGRPRKPENELKKKKKKTGRLWEFIRNLLLDPETCPSLVKWENAEEGLFRFMDAEKVARRWGDRKQNKEMNYEKLSRAMRYYYKTHIFEAVIGRRLVYKFGKNAKGWRPKNPNFPDVHQNPPPPQPPPPPPVHHHTDTTQQLHHLTESTSQLHHHSDSTTHLHHHSDPPLPPPPPAHHHQPHTPPHHHHHQQESQHLSQYHHDSPPPPQIVHQPTTPPPPQPLAHHHHPHPLQSLTLHHHHHQHPHHTS